MCKVGLCQDSYFLNVSSTFGFFLLWPCDFLSLSTSSIFFFFNVLGLIPLFYYLSLQPTMKFPKVEIFKAIPTQYYVDPHHITFAYTPPPYSKVLLSIFFLSLNTWPLRFQFDTRIPLVPMLQVTLSTHIWTKA